MDKLNLIVNKLVLIVALAMAMGAFCSCSSHDAPEVKEGEEIVNRFKSLFMNDKGEIQLFSLSQEGNEYVTPCEDEDEAVRLCRSLLMDMVDGSADGIYRLPDDCGLIKVIDNGSEGIYRTLLFQVKGIPTFTFHMASNEFFENIDNAAGRYTPMWTCSKCGRVIVTRAKPNKCCEDGEWILTGGTKIPTYA